MLATAEEVLLVAFCVSYQKPQLPDLLLNPTSQSSFCLSGLMCCTELQYNCSGTQAIAKQAKIWKFSRLIAIK